MTAEDLLAGALLSDPEARERILLGLDAADLVSPDWRTLREVVGTMSDLGYPIEPIAVSAMSEKMGHRLDLDKLHEVRDLVSSHPQVLTSPSYYLELVADAARERRAVAAAQAVIDKVRTTPDLDVAAELADALKTLQKSPPTPRGGWYSELVPDFIEEVRGTWDGTRPPLVVPTGWPKLNGMLRGGLHPGELTVVGARPGMGKTGFAINLLQDVARAGHRVAFFSAEMTARAVLRRASMEFTGLTGTLLDKVGPTGHDSLEQQRHRYVEQVLQDMARLPVYVDDTSRPSTAYMERKLAQLGDIDVVVFDYLTLSSDQAKDNSTTARITAVSENLASLAKDMNVHVVALSQLSRAVESRAQDDFVPTLSDLRDSGQVEANAHTVLLLYRRQYYVGLKRLSDDGNADTMRVIVAKNRDGQLGDVELLFDGATMRLSEVDPRTKVRSFGQRIA